jgi:Uncharacterized protein conserved in bacteria
MSEYKVTVLDFPKKHLAGLKVRTSMSRANTDCSDLWQSFGPRLGELASPGAGQGAYGVSIMLNAEDFDYWATIEFDPAAGVPAGLERIEIPACPYAKLTVSNLDKVSEAYMFLYEDWLKSQTAYTYKMDGPCLEFYPPNWQPAEPFEIFMPLTKA